MSMLIRAALPGRAETPAPGPTTSTDPDVDLVEMLRGGRSEGAEALVARFGRHAYGLALRITGNTSDAEEVTQDALWRAFNKIQTFRGESAFRSWVYRITANAAYVKLRQRHHQRHEVSWEDSLPSFDDRGRHAAPITDWSPRIEDPAIQNELRAELTRAIERLPPEYRSVFIMRDVDGLANAEIADALAMSVAAVKSRLHRARLFLRECLSRYWATQPGAAEHPPARDVARFTAASRQPATRVPTSIRPTAARAQRHPGAHLRAAPERAAL